jgi:uncharacterized protein
MIIVDANLLIYAVNKEDPFHARAKAWLESVMGGPETVGSSWNVLLAFLRITTRPGLLHKQLTVKQAFDLIDEWLASPVAVILNPGKRHHSLLRPLLIARGSGGNITSDAHLAALAIEHEAELFTADDDFSRFDGLRWRNPLS